MAPQHHAQVSEPSAQEPLRDSEDSADFSMRNSFRESQLSVNTEVAKRMRISSGAARNIEMRSPQKDSMRNPFASGRDEENSSIASRVSKHSLQNPFDTKEKDEKEDIFVFFSEFQAIPSHRSANTSHSQSPNEAKGSKGRRQGR